MTGNLVWRPAEAPHWYDALDEGARWRVQEAFWRLVGGALATSDGVFAYELTSEPIVSDGIDPHSFRA